MHRYAGVILCVMGVLTGTAQAQNLSIEPVRVATGTVLTFHLQTRLNPTEKNQMDALPKGTVLRVKMLNALDSGVDRDGAAFRGAVVAPVVVGNEIVVHSESEVRGVLALLRSRNHPEGFRYELLVTSVTDHGKTYDLTASLNPSFFDGGTQRPSASNTETKEVPKANTPVSAKAAQPTLN